MKETRSLVNSLLVCGVALAMVASASAQSKEYVAKVIRVQGPARVLSSTGEPQPLKAGALVKAGSVVQTGVDKDCYVDLILGDASSPIPAVTAAKKNGAGSGAGAKGAVTQQNVVRVSANSVLGIDKLTATETGAGIVTETALDLRKGKIYGTVKKMTAGSKYEVKYPNGVAGIRGSSYSMELVEGIVDGKVKIYCKLCMSTGAGVISFYNDKGDLITQAVMPSFYYDTATLQLNPIPGDVIVFLDRVLQEMGVPPVIVERVLNTDQTHVEFVTGTVGH